MHLEVTVTEGARRRDRVFALDWREAVIFGLGVVETLVVLRGDWSSRLLGARDACEGGGRRGDGESEELTLAGVESAERVEGAVLVKGDGRRGSVGARRRFVGLWNVRLFGTLESEIERVFLARGEAVEADDAAARIDLLVLEVDARTLAALGA